MANTAAWSKVIAILTDELRIDPQEIEDSDDFVSLGINSMMASHLLTVLRDPLGEPLPRDIFREHQNIGALRRYYEKLAIAAGPGPSPVAAKPSSAAAATPLSMLLQNNPATSSRNIFLLPDGSGSALSYSHLSSIHPSVCVIGLNSPHLRNPTQYQSSIESLAATWVKEIYRRQPEGPYILGGWSAGGFYAYEVAKRILRDGEEVEKLILIDSPCRAVFESVPMEVIEYAAANNLMGKWATQKPPQWLVEHFRHTLAAIDAYKPLPIEYADEMETYIIWGRDGVQDEKTLASSGLDLSVKVSKFILHEKTDVGPHGWDQLLPSSEFLIGTTSGTHFSMVTKPHVSELSDLVRSAVLGLGGSNWNRVENTRG
ncbi:Non-reducing polyketide synthase terA [Cladobotryum mycophilum]|uniref:Non-reducing polyketide synthase terA n=1 Tax=Cladobotryum mycophilum TaxID=491253 RepID=A0ABR0T3X2_9HYPO